MSALPPKAVRAESAAHADQRLLANLQRYGIPTAACAAARYDVCFAP
jgi:hypothetical protein